MTDTFHVTTFYRFLDIEQERLPAQQALLDDFGTKHQLNGLILLAPEGINGTVAGAENALAELRVVLEQNFGAIDYKDSVCDQRPFRRFKVKIKPEIVALGEPTLSPRGKGETHLSPAQWQRVLDQEDVALIDTRNAYETALGVFKGAIDPEIDKFNQFPEFVQKCEIPKEKKVLMYCTGGIRCEKAILEMNRQGYENVYQLDGGILKYLEQYPNRSFDGECFVFDHRVAVDQNLQPSKTYDLCPHCGDPGKEQITCVHCGKRAIICDDCIMITHFRTCSKNCAHHYQNAEAGAQE